jgi:3-deoxy-D-manno-octulosonic-acid transferase
VLVPRHFERGKEVGRELQELGVKFIFRSEITANTQFALGEIGCLLVNTTGELKYFYEHATVIFVGKSLKGQGGQNPIEPGALGKPMVFGPNMQNFQDVAKSFVAQNGAVQVKDAAELEKALSQLLADEWPHGGHDCSKLERSIDLHSRHCLSFGMAFRPCVSSNHQYAAKCPRHYNILFNVIYPELRSWGARPPRA